MTLPPRATEIPELVRRLGSRRQAHVDAARARLAIIGARAVEALIEAIEGDHARIRAHAMPLLALIQDPRGRAPLVAMLLDEDPKMRELAARSLARFPCRESMVALVHCLKADPRLEVRAAAAEALVEQYASGHEPALGRVLEVLFDARQETRVRLAALAVLPALKAAERRGVLHQLREDADGAVAARAAEIEEGGDGGAEPRTGGAPPDPELIRLIHELGARDYPVWNEAVHRLTGAGARVVASLVDEMRRRSHDPEYCSRAGMVLKGLGPRRARALADALETVEEPLPLQVVVETIGTFGENRMIYGLKSLIDRIAAAPSAEDNGVDPMQRVRAKAHLELARIGSRVAVEDLREALRDRSRRLEIEMLAAVEKIGKREEIADLVRAWRREDRYVRDRIAGVVQTIMKRERIRRNHPSFTAFTPDMRRVLDLVLVPPAVRKAARRKKR